MGRAGKPGSPLLCLSSPLHPAPCQHPPLPPSLHPSLHPCTLRCGGVQPGCGRVGCIPDLSFLQRVVSETLQGQLEELEGAAARLQELCPAGLCPVSRVVQGTLRAWAGLRELLRETRARVQQAGRLRRFFKDYLAMM